MALSLLYRIRVPVVYPVHPIRKRKKAGRIAWGIAIVVLLNAADAMPQTIILDKQGVVTYNAQAPLTLEKLEALYDQANQ